MSAKEKLANEKGREPTILEIAKEVYEDIRSEYTEWSKWTPLEEDWDEYAKVLSAFL